MKSRHPLSLLEVPFPRKSLARERRRARYDLCLGCADNETDRSAFAPPAQTWPRRRRRWGNRGQSGFSSCNCACHTARAKLKGNRHHAQQRTSRGWNLAPIRQNVSECPPLRTRITRQLKKLLQLKKKTSQDLSTAIPSSNAFGARISCLA